MPVDSRQYDSAAGFIDDASAFSKVVGNLSNNDDRVRLKAYQLYEDMYHNRSEHIKITMRSDDEEDSIEIYVPSAKMCIEAIHRFLGKNLQVIPDPTIETPANAAIVAGVLGKLFERERMKSKFSQLTRYMLIKGDALLHVCGYPDKPAGRRVSIKELKPEHYFPIESLVTGDIIGCHIVDIIPNPRNSPATRSYTGQEVVRRQTYTKEFDEDMNATGTIYSELALYEVGKWDDRVLPTHELRKVEQLRDPYPLPPQINQLPVYKWSNVPPPGSSFGMSELAGVETVITAINQSMSDEDLTLIMQGLGVYWTDAAPPLNERGEEVEWEISPRSVVQVASGGQFGRVTGISTVQPFGDHIKALEESLMRALGVPDIAIGVVDVTIAESGIALQLKLGPLLAKNAEKEVDLQDITNQFLYDLVQGWLPAYEGVDTEGVLFVSKFDDPMPKNASKELADLTLLWGSAQSVLPVAWFYEQLNNIMGYHLDPMGDFEQALADAQRIAESQAPPMPEPLPGEGGGETASAEASSSNGSSSNGKAK